ncbi:MAG: pilA [Magnetococcales bacterium]|nr:pilA [Magnetococcales bacterium]
MKYQHEQQGFTLIELMIVIAIIGILAAVAVPAYQDYTVRAKMADPLSKADAAKSQVSEYFATQGSWPADNTTAGLAQVSEYTSAYVSTLSIASSVLTIVLKTIKTGVIDSGATIVFTGTDAKGTIAWACSAGAIPQRFLPRTCVGL